MEVIILEIGQMIRKVVKDAIIGQIIKDMKETGKKIKNMAKVKSLLFFIYFNNTFFSKNFIC